MVSSRSAALGLLLLALQWTAVAAMNIFHFGDSYSDTGFQPTGGMPSSGNLLGNPSFPGNTILGEQKANWVGMFLKGNGGSDGSPTLFYNYASSGACVNQSTEGCKTPGPKDLGEQYGMFEKNKGLLRGEADVVSIYFGTNDINAEGMHPATLPTIVGWITDTLASLYADGARNFVVFGMDPLYRVPGYTAEGKPLMGNLAAALGVATWNYELARQTDAFAAAHADVSLQVVNTWAVFSRILDDPRAHGAPNDTCFNADATSCLWHDDLHPGDAIQQALADAYADTLKGMKLL